jgi:spermidine synthase
MDTKIHLHKNSTSHSARVLNLPIFCDNSQMQLKVTRVLYEVTSPFQDILIVDTKEFGKCLIIDGIMQSTEYDHELYDKELLKYLRPSDKKILVLGGGDGYIAQTALKMNKELRIRVVDLDAEVVHGVKRSLNQKIFDDPRVNLAIGEALHYFKTTASKYDGVVCDLTDAPIGTRKEREKFKSFYKEVISLAKQKLKVHGWISVQGGATATTAHFIDEAAIIEKILKAEFSNVEKTSITIPSYGELCSFLFAKNTENEK